MPAPPTLDEAALLDALSHWDLGAPLHIAPITGGINSQIWKVTSSAGRFVAKFVWDAGPFEAGLDIAEQLDSIGLPTQRPLRMRDGALVLSMRGGALGVVEFVPGTPLDASTADGMRLWGATTAQLHRALLELPRIPASIARWP